MELNGVLYDPRDDPIEFFDERLPKRYVRDAQNPLDWYREREFKERYRFSKISVIDGILPLIEVPLTKENKRGLPIPPLMQLLACLRYYATGSFQKVNGDLMTISQSSISRIVFRVSSLLAAQMRTLIKMPSTNEKKLAVRQAFKEIGRGRGDVGLPGIDGAIDCTHIRLSNTHLNQIQEVYRNRKGYFSLNVQAVVGPSMEFFDLVPEWPGSQHDSRIFQNSRLYTRYMGRQLDGCLVGDAGYPCLPFLLTPLANPETEAQRRYNDVHTRTRITVERAFGIWKRRFPCLSKGLSTKLICSTTIVVACAVLHNLGIIYNEGPLHDELVEDEVVPEEAPNWQPGDGFATRDALIERIFQ